MAAVSKTAPAVGIDLGTTFSCVAVVKNGLVQTIYNGQGHYVTPSWVSFTEEEVLVGEPARIASAGNSKNTVFNAKRLIGRHFDDWEQEYKSEYPHWPFKVVNVNDKPFFQVKYNNREQNISPQEISSFVLKNLKKSAEDFLQQPIKDAVISVPANFNYAQRLATEEAAKLAGFNVLRLCSEPAMAGIMHEPLQNIYTKKTLLVFDCGGGTTDVAVLSISKDGAYDILATAGNMSLGGENIVDRLLNYFLEKLKEETGKDYSANEEAVRRLKRTCEEAKCQLSFAEAYTVCFDYQCEPKTWKLTRARFNAMNADLFEKMLVPVADAIKGAGLDKSKIDEVLLAGGTSRILDVQQRLTKFFEGKPIRKSVNPEQAIAQGAAVVAAVLSGDKSSAILSNRMLYEVAPLSLSIQITHGELTAIVPRNTKLPFKVTHIFSTATDNQSYVKFQVYEGERFLGTDCTDGYLGIVELSDFTLGRRGQVSFKLTFEVNASGIMQVTAVEPQSGKTSTLQLMSKNRQRDSQTVAAMIENATENITVDAVHRQRVQDLRSFEDLVYKRKHQEEDERHPSPKVLFACERALQWIKDHGQSVSVRSIKGRRDQFVEFYSPPNKMIVNEFQAIKLS